MKKIILLIAVALLATSTGSFAKDYTLQAIDNLSDRNEQLSSANIAKERKKLERQAQAADQLAEAKAKENAVFQAQQEKRLADIKTFGAGWVKTSDEINGLKSDINQLQVVRSFTSAQKEMNVISGDGGSGMQFGQILGISDSITRVYPGSTVNLRVGAGHLIENNSVVDYASWKLLKYTKDADNGLHYLCTFADTIVTVKISDGTNMLLAKINLEDPSKSRISDASLPVNAMTSISNRGIALSEKAIMTSIEGFYKDEFQVKGISLLEMMGNLLSDVDTRDRFVEYVINHKPAKK